MPEFKILFSVHRIQNSGLFHFSPKKHGLEIGGLKSAPTLEFSARSRFTNRKFPFVCYGSLGHIFIHVHFSSLWICEKVKWCLTSNFRCIFFIVVVINSLVCTKFFHTVWIDQRFFLLFCSYFVYFLCNIFSCHPTFANIVGNFDLKKLSSY